MQHEIAEIDGVYRAEPRLIGRVERRRTPVRVIGAVRTRYLVDGQPPVLPTLDDDREGACRPSLLVDVRRPDDLLQQANLVVGVEDGEVRLEPGELGMAAEDPGGDGMEGAEPEPGGGASHQSLHAADHFARRLVGEGDREHLSGPGAAGGENVGKARGEHAGLAGAGAREHEQRTVERFRRPALLRIQAVEIGRRGRRRRRPGVGLGGQAERGFEGLVHGPRRGRIRRL